MKTTIKMTIIVLVVLGLFHACTPSPRLVWKATRDYNPVQLTDEEIQVLDSFVNNEETGSFDIEQFALEMTAKKLQFAERNDIANGKANCVGYARYCATVLNYMFEARRDICPEDSACPVVGYIYWGKVNINDIAKKLAPEIYKNFVKDHDFVAIDNDDALVYYDPLFYDYCNDDLYTFALIKRMTTE